MNTEKFEIVLRWVDHREEARLNKEAGKPKPWTDDPIIQQYRFCNVNRCHDKETKGIFRLLDEAHWINMVVARFINKTSTLERLGFPWEEWDEKRFLETLDEMQANGETIYTSAYMIRGGTGEDALLPKHYYLNRRIFTPMWEARNLCPPKGSSLQTWADWLQKFFGMGDFMTNQIITDMKYLRNDLLTAPDWETFLLPGPGTIRGLNRLYERPKDYVGSTRASLVRETLEIRERLIEARPAMRETFLDLNNVSNTLCEFDKYCRVYYNEPGRPKQRYPGQA